MKFFILFWITLFWFNACGGDATTTTVYVDTTILDDANTNSTGPLQAVAVTTNQVPLLVIRIEYDDIRLINDAQTWSNKIFGDNLSQLNHYYNSVSYGSFGFARAVESAGVLNDGIATVHLAKNHPDPGLNVELLHPDMKTALVALEDSMDFASYDTNANGIIDITELALVFIVAGQEDAISTTGEKGVYAHSYCVAAEDVATVDATRLMGCFDNAGYALFGERHNSYEATIGVIAHELGHSVLGLPDLYDTDYTSAGIGYFGVMSGGSWTYAPGERAGDRPTHLSAWSKIYVAWDINVTTVASGTTINAVLNDTNSANYNIIKIPMSASEYFLVENRSISGYDKGLEATGFAYEGGLAIWHIDESVINAKYATNTINNDETNKGIDLEEASATLNMDLSSDNQGDSSHLFFDANNVLFDSTTTPNTNQNDGTVSAVNVNSISTTSASMSLSVSN